MIAPAHRAFIPVRPADLWDPHARVQSESSPLCALRNCRRWSSLGPVRSSNRGQSVSDRKFHAFFINTTPPCLSQVSQRRGGGLRLAAYADANTHKAKQDRELHGEPVNTNREACTCNHTCRFFFFKNDVRVTGTFRPTPSG